MSRTDCGRTITRVDGPVRNARGVSVRVIAVFLLFGSGVVAVAVIVAAVSLIQ